jgi:hypothetical protein
MYWPVYGFGYQIFRRCDTLYSIKKYIVFYLTTDPPRFSTALLYWSPKVKNFKKEKNIKINYNTVSNMQKKLNKSVHMHGIIYEPCA